MSGGRHMSLLPHDHFRQLGPVGAEYVRGASETRVKRVNRPENLDRALRIGNRRIQEGRFISSVLPFGVLGRSVPGGRHDALIVGDLAVFDMDPVAKGAARSFLEA